MKIVNMVEVIVTLIMSIIFLFVCMNSDNVGLMFVYGFNTLVWFIFCIRTQIIFEIKQIKK